MYLKNNDVRVPSFISSGAPRFCPTPIYGASGAELPGHKLDTGDDWPSSPKPDNHETAANRLKLAENSRPFQFSQWLTEVEFKPFVSD